MSATLALNDSLLRGLGTGISGYDPHPVEGTLSPNAEPDGISTYFSQVPDSFTSNLISRNPLPLGIHRIYSSSHHAGTAPFDPSETTSVYSYNHSLAFSNYGDPEPHVWDTGRHPHQRSHSVTQEDDLRGLTMPVEPRKLYQNNFADPASPQAPFSWPTQEYDDNLSREHTAEDLDADRGQSNKKAKLSSAETDSVGSASRTSPAKATSIQQQDRARKKRGPVPSKILVACRECSRSFRNRSDLRRHRAKHTRPFPCPFAFAGCNSTFSSKNEWARHVMTIHERIYWYRCDQPRCEVGLFNRRDLFKCHYLRAHKFSHDRVEELLDNCREEDASAIWPTTISCGFKGCDKVTTSSNGNEKDPATWRDWLEHRAEHYLNEKNWPVVKEHFVIDNSIIEWGLKRKHITEKDGGYVFLSKRNR